jgi:transposase
MLRKEDLAVIKSLHRRGVFIRDIAQELGVHPKTISRALKKEGVPQPEQKHLECKLAPYKSKIDQLLSEGVWNGKVILRELQAQGYTGGYTMLRQYIQPKRPERLSRATVRYETQPGEQLQSDWGEVTTQIAGQPTKVSFIVNTLGYSRRFHFWCTDSQDAEHTYEGIIRSFEYIGGVTEEVLVDNQKSAVLEHPAHGPVRFNERFVDLSLHYGFTPRACKPHRPRTKGKDERMVGYVQNNFFVRYRQFESWAHLNQQAEIWLACEADQRVQGTVHEVVRERFQREKSALKLLPQVRYDTSYFEFRRVAWDGYIDVRGNRYSVPAHLVGQRVAVRIGLEGTLRVYQAETLVAMHPLRSRQAGWSTIPEHQTDLWNDPLKVEQRSLDVYEEVGHGTG